MMTEAIATIRKLGALEPELLMYSHGGVWKEPKQRIERIIENTCTCADIVLNCLRQDLSSQEIGEVMLKHAANQFPPEWEDDMLRVWRNGIVEGCSIYFKKKGLA